MKITNVRTRVVEWRGKTVPFAAAFLYESDGCAGDSAVVDEHVYVSWVVDL